MVNFFSDEKNVQILVALMKLHGIKKVIASPGSSNIPVVASLQKDPFFEIYSSVDERSAAYIACGLAAETGEPVALTCTGATASRNYMPGLTEAFYRKLPVLAITGAQHPGRVGRHVPQVLDRSQVPNDVVKVSVEIPTIHDREDQWACELKINEALLALRHRGGGPAHINIVIEDKKSFNTPELPPVRFIERFTYGEELPAIRHDRVGVFVGAHNAWSHELTQAVDLFCEKYNAVVLCDRTSNYFGKYRVQGNLVREQENAPKRAVELMIHIGEISGAYMKTYPAEVWRVNPDGELRDPNHKLRCVFEMEEIDFFRQYTEMAPEGKKQSSFVNEWADAHAALLSRLGELPFSNPWIAQQTLPRLPEGSVLHLGILNSLRAWNYFDSPAAVRGYCNTGGFGIDGCVSALIGASLADKNKLYFGVVGDLAFFYDLNSLGNRHIGKNLRILLVNNGKGTEFRHYSNNGAQFGEDADLYMAAAGHYGNQSPQLVRHYAEDLGFEYMSASNKDEYLAQLERFVLPEISGKSIIFEVFTNNQDESDAIYALRHLSPTEE